MVSQKSNLMLSWRVPNIKKGGDYFPPFTITNNLIMKNGKFTRTILW